MIYDISQPLFECKVFPGDPKPVKTAVRRMENGDLYNLTEISMCVHNGTHIDAPLHFLKDGKGVNRIPLDKFIGTAYVAGHEGDVTARDAENILEKAEWEHCGAEKKILIKGKAVVTLEAAQVFAQAGIDLLGNESQTVGPENAPMAVHLVLLEKEVVLLEGIRLSGVAEGAYFLNAAPLDLTDTDGSPCRAVIMDMPLEETR